MDVKMKTRVHSKGMNVNQILTPLWNTNRAQCVH